MTGTQPPMSDPVAPRFDGTQPCARVDPELFFSPGGDIGRAKGVCARCRFADACLSYALRYSIDFGIWGGLTEDERKPMRRHLRGAA